VIFNPSIRSDLKGGVYCILYLPLRLSHESYQSYNFLISPVIDGSLSTFQLTIHQSTVKRLTMRNLLYLVAVILLIGWAIGFFAYSVGGVIHILLVIAVIALLLNIIQGRRG
jgi:hypothetical protein